MTEGFRPRRSVLYMPAANERALEKAKGLAADALIFDLEDAVGPDQKEVARERACAAVTAGGYRHREIAIRANGLGTQWHDQDVAAIAAAGPDAMLVPKVDSPEQVHQLVAALDRNGAPASTALWAMLETPRAVLHAEAIASASPRLTVLVMGTNDLIKELRVSPSPDRFALLSALELCVLGARAAGKTILDGVFNDVTDEGGFSAEAAQGRALGFDGKTLVHPSQVAPCNAAFSPSMEELDRARAVIAAFDEAQAAGRGVVTVDGRMIENLHVEESRRVLAIAAALNRDA